MSYHEMACDAGYDSKHPDHESIERMAEDMHRKLLDDLEIEQSIEYESLIKERDEAITKLKEYEARRCGECEHREFYQCNKFNFEIDSHYHNYKSWSKK